MAHTRPYTAAPPVRLGSDRLPHCRACVSDEDLCNYHRHRVTAALGQLLSATIYASHTVDLRYLIEADRRRRGAA